MSNIDDQLDPIIDAHLRHLEGEGPAPDLDTLPAELREEAQARVALLDALWGAQVDTPAEDPVARRFGFDRAGEEIAINGRRISSLRKGAGINLADLLNRLTTAGGTITAPALLSLEQSPYTIVNQPTASALVAALNTDLAYIEAERNDDLGPIKAFLRSPSFRDLIDPWAIDHHRAPDDVAAVVADRLRTAQYRAEDVTTNQLVAIVQAILDALEP